VNHHELCSGSVCTCEPDDYGHMPSCPSMYCICALLHIAEERSYERAVQDVRNQVSALHWTFPDAAEWEDAYRSGADPTRIPNRAVVSRKDVLEVLDRMMREK
jgi:hypothetical protein